MKLTIECDENSFALDYSTIGFIDDIKIIRAIGPTDDNLIFINL